MSFTFTKLFSSITESTIWIESDRTRIVWIAMLAMCDRKGRVWASLPGLANRARVPLEDCEKAIATFLGPDRYSRTPANDGRRIEVIEGGWRLLNYDKYRAIRDEETILESKRRYINTRRALEKANGVENVEQSRPQYTQAEAEAEAEKRRSPIIPAAAGARDAELERIWQHYPKKTGKQAALPEIRKAIKEHGVERIEERTRAYAEAVARWSADDRKFIPDPVRWFKRGNFDDDPAAWERNGSAFGNGGFPLDPDQQARAKAF